MLAAECGRRIIQISVLGIRLIVSLCGLLLFKNEAALLAKVKELVTVEHDSQCSRQPEDDSSHNGNPSPEALSASSERWQQMLSFQLSC
ncbi:hypothetical protein [Neorhizobium galegae]|uniref:hypothetical protein n=1 Tax=Neorhizobium galegae TaxID=399 RepID=UPI000589CDB4|nr:hypothetical protein [Neorhizobium galegae]